MKINLAKKVFTSEEINFMLLQLQTALENGYLQQKFENNGYLIAAYAGVEEKGITPKWNIKIYSYNYNKRGHSIVCVDSYVLSKLLDKEYNFFIPPDLDVIRIDDAGWGFPLGGIMVGVSDEHLVKSAIVPVSYFRNDTHNGYYTKKYLKKYSTLAINLVEEFGASPETHRIEICTGYVNQPIRERLRKLGYDVRVVEIKGLLQNKLEEIFKNYIKDEIGADIYYDPKEMKKSDLPRMYRKCLNYGLKHCPNQLKTGWDSLKSVTKRKRFKKSKRY